METESEEKENSVPVFPMQEAEEDLIRECCLSLDQLQTLCHQQNTSEPVIDLNTHGQNNILSFKPRIYKHQLLKLSHFRMRIIEYYKSLNYIWVDIVVLNRRYWKIFLYRDK